MSISVEGQGPDDLLLQSFTGVEAISRPFSFQVDLLSQSPSVNFLQIIGKKATITLKTLDPAKPRYFSGYISRFAQSGSDTRFYHYHMEIVPWIWFLSRHADCRIFHNKTIPEILQLVFDAFTAKPKVAPTKNLTAAYTKQEYTVQYRETTLNFISRLMEHAGIYYYFEHTQDNHVLWLADNSSSASDCPIQSNVSHLVRNTEDMDEDHLSGFYSRREFRTGTYTSTDYNFKTPSTSLVALESTVVSVGGNDPLEMFDYPGIHSTTEEGRKISKIRMEEQEAAHHLLSGSGRVRSLIPGFAFTLQDHYREDLNLSYLITEVRHTASVGDTYLTGEGGGDGYSNQFTCIPKSVPFRPARLTPKPLVQGPQTAVVIGAGQDTGDDTASDDDAGNSNEEIWVDKYGRVIVRFPWDRAGACSCRVRVSQAWAGEGWGGITIPRVGQEVIVSFLDGDPDRPIITGRVYNAEKTVPYKLPDYQTRSTFMTRSSAGGSAANYNELRFEDKTGSEQVFVRGEKDYDTWIKNDSREWIGNNRSLLVVNDQMESVGNDLHLQVGGKKVEKVTGDVQLAVTGNQTEAVTGDLNCAVSGDFKHKTEGTISIQAGSNLYEKSGQNFAHEAGMAIHLKAGMTLILEAGTQLSLKVGGSFVDIGPSGVSISGPMVMINSGGAAGSGCGSSPASPASPGQPTDPDKADDGSKGTKM
ncbi:MAG TPA: type VI secretion system tip protein TssI/VgrG [Terracidiphilus sp.]